MTWTPFSRHWRWLVLASPLPALVLGALLMNRHGLPAAIYGQNLIVGLFLIFAGAGCFRLLCLPDKRLRAGTVLTTILSVGLLLATFGDAGLDGVHRWVVVGTVRIHAGAICLPVLILALGEGLARPARKSVTCLASLVGIVVAGLLLLQPDAAEASAFAGAFAILLLSGRHTLWVRWAAALAAAVCAGWSWKRPDPLTSIPHVEGVVGLAAENGVFWLAASLLSLALLPWPFLLYRERDGRASPKALALGVYFALKVIAPCFGPFPVPLLGYGLSPVIGYFVALTWLLSVTATRTPRASEGGASPGCGGAGNA